MAIDHETVIRAQYQVLGVERAREVAEYESWRLAEDEYETMRAAGRILETDQKIAALDRITNNFVAGQQQQQQGNQFGLNKDEQEVARNMFSGEMTDADRERIYAQNKERLRYMRATGEYRDDHGKFSR